VTSRLGTGMSLNFFYSVMWARRTLKAERQRCEKGGGAGENGDENEKGDARRR
jgi:hypothetical protein